MLSSPLNLKQIAKYTIENGNCAAARKFSAPLDKPINESSVCSWVVAYKKELRRKRRIGEALPDVQVLPECKFRYTTLYVLYVIYVTLRAKTSLVHTSKFATSMPYTFCWERGSKFTAVID